MTTPERIGELMFRYLRNELSPVEESELLDWRRLSPENEAFFQEETDPDRIRQEISDMYESMDIVAGKIRERYPDFPMEKEFVGFRKKRLVSLSMVLKFAAIFIVTLIIGWILFTRLFNLKNQPGVNNTISGLSPVKPGGNRAILTLSNGRSISVDSIRNGRIGNEGAVVIEKKDSGELTYSPSYPQESEGSVINILSTPRGGQFSIVLSDGTKVWLNAASSLKYPSSFTGNDRSVELSGEAYFEVAKNAKAPFHVNSGSMRVEVLGTHFDVAAYADEPIFSTTLLEGSVEVKHYDNLRILKPGQQAQVAREGSIRLVTDADTRSVVAWKDGKTSFNNASVQTIMRAISRWYDVEVVFKGNIPDKKINGGLPRNTDLTELLTVLAQSGIHFSVEGKTITVTP